MKASIAEALAKELESENNSLKEQLAQAKVTAEEEAKQTVEDFKQSEELEQLIVDHQASISTVCCTL